MIRASALVAGILAVHLAHADPSRPASTPAEQALVRNLEARYAQCMQAARRGDVAGYWRLRTDASRTRQPELDADRVRLLAQVLPPLETLEFVRLDASTKTARSLYRWRKSDVAQYSVLVFRQEQGEWKLDDVSVRRSPANGGSPGAATAPRPAAAPGAVAPSPDPAMHALDPPSQALLRAWSSGKPDSGRALEAPRL